MVVMLLLAFAGFLWLTNRFSLLLSLPIELSVRALGIPIPRVPLLSVDKVTDTCIVFHWSDVSGNSTGNVKGDTADDAATAKKDTTQANLKETDTSLVISHYVLYINGIETLAIDGMQQTCTLEDLQPSSNYQIDLVAFNNAGFKSRSSPIFVKTAAKPFKTNNFQTLENIDHVIKTLLQEQERASLMKSDPFKSSQGLPAAPSTTTGTRSRSGTIDGNSYPHNNATKQTNTNTNTGTNNNSNASPGSTKTKHPHLIEDINELKWILEIGLVEVQSLMKSYKEMEMEFEEEEMNLISTRDEARERKKFEDNNRSNLRQEIKMLEEQRVKGATRIKVDEKKIKERSKKIEDMNSEINKLTLEIKEMKEHREFLKKDEPLALKKLDKEAEEVSASILTLLSEISDIEMDVRDEVSLKKQLEEKRTKTSKLFVRINENIDDVTGILNEEGNRYMEELFLLHPEWKDELHEQIIHIDTRAEAEYKALQQMEWQNFNRIKKEIEEERQMALMKSTELLNANNLNNSTTNMMQSLTARDVENSLPTTATNTVNANGYLYNSLSASVGSVGANNNNNNNNNNTKGNSNSDSSNSNGNNNNKNSHGNSKGNGFAHQSNQSNNIFSTQSFNAELMKNLIRPKVSTSGSFQGTNNTNDLMNDQFSRQDNGNTNPWNNNDMATDTGNGLSSMNMLLPQNLIDGGDFDRMFANQQQNNNVDNLSTMNNNAGSIDLLSPQLSSINLPPTMQPSQSFLLSNNNGNANNVAPVSASPSISQMNGFDVYLNTHNLNGFGINSTPQHNRVTSLSALASSANQSQNNMMLGSTGNTGMNLMSSPPPSLNAHLSTADTSGMSGNMLDLGHAATQSPFNSNNGLNGIGVHDLSVGEIDPVSAFFSSNVMGENASQYSRIFGTFPNNGNGSLAESSSNLNLNLNDNINASASANANGNNEFVASRGRSTSFGSSIWSNGNTNNSHGNWGNFNLGNTVGKKNNNGHKTHTQQSKSSNGFSFLGAPISISAGEGNNLIPHITMSHAPPSAAPVGDDDKERRASNSPSFLKSVITKFGSSPSKTLSNNTMGDEEDIDEEGDSVEISSLGSHGPSHLHSGGGPGSSNFHSSAQSTTSSGGNHGKSSSFGSSRFFKLAQRKNSVAASAHSGSSSTGNVSTDVVSNGVIVEDETDNNHGGSGSGGTGFMGRKLSFAFKREKDKDKDKDKEKEKDKDKEGGEK